MGERLTGYVYYYLLNACMWVKLSSFFIHVILILFTMLPEILYEWKMLGSANIFYAKMKLSNYVESIVIFLQNFTRILEKFWRALQMTREFLLCKNHLLTGYMAYILYFLFYKIISKSWVPNYDLNMTKYITKIKR